MQHCMRLSVDKLCRSPIHCGLHIIYVVCGVLKLSLLMRLFVEDHLIAYFVVSL